MYMHGAVWNATCGFPAFVGLFLILASLHEWICCYALCIGAFWNEDDQFIVNRVVCSCFSLHSKHHYVSLWCSSVHATCIGANLQRIISGTKKKVSWEGRCHCSCFLRMLSRSIWFCWRAPPTKLHKTVDQARYSACSLESRIPQIYE